nr:hypothetical protein CFP56_25155 [Quercus suber]
MLQTHLPSSSLPCMEVFVQFQHTQVQKTQKGLDLNYVRRVHMLAAGFTVVDTMTYRNLNSETFLHDAVLMDLIVQYDKLEYQVFLEKKEVKKEI